MFLTARIALLNDAMLSHGSGVYYELAFMKRVTSYLVLLGIFVWVAPFLAWLTPVAGNAFVSSHSRPSLLTSLGAFVYGAVCFWLAWGIHRRLRAVWRVGLFGFVASWVLAFVLVFFFIAADTQPYAPLGKVASAALIMLGVSLVFFYWGSLWYKNRGYFVD